MLAICLPWVLGLLGRATELEACVFAFLEGQNAREFFSMDFGVAGIDFCVSGETP